MTNLFSFYEDSFLDLMSILNFSKNKKAPEVVEENYYKKHKYWIVDWGSYKCAYVEINKNHQFYDQARQGKYNDIKINVHGGLTYASSKLLDVAYNTSIIGWDYAHYYDLGKNISNKDIEKDIKKVIKQLEVIK